MVKKMLMVNITLLQNKVTEPDRNLQKASLTTTALYRDY